MEKSILKVGKEKKLSTLCSLRGYMKPWNSKYKQKSKLLDRHDLEEIIKRDGYFKWKYGNKWVKNYEQLVPIIKDISKREKSNRRTVERRTKKSKIIFWHSFGIVKNGKITLQKNQRKQYIVAL